MRKNIIFTLILLNLGSSSVFSMDAEVGDDRQEGTSLLKMNSLTAEITRLEGETPPQQTSNHLAHSAPAVQSKSNDKETKDDVFTTPVQSKIRKAPSTEPASRKPKSDEEVYRDQQ